jgi:anti-sigma factor RsiW
MESEKQRRFQSCREVFAELSAYLDAELPEEACQEIEEHVAGCVPCIEFVNSLRKTVEICRRYEPGALPEPLTTRAREQLLGAYRSMLSARRSGPSAGS